jgi:HEAT repeat protein
MRRCNTLVVLAIGFSLLCIMTVELRAIQGPPPAQLLLEQFKTAEAFTQQFEVAKKIVTLNDVRVLQQLKGFLNNQDRHLRGNAAFVFAGLGDEQGFEVLYGILTDTSDRVKGPGIATAPGNGIVSLAAQIHTDRYYAVHLLGTLKDPRTLPVLIPLLRDESVSYKVAWALGEIGGRAAVDALMGALADKSPDVRVIAIQSLESLGATEALPRLRSMLNDNEKSHFGSLQSVADAARAAIAKLQKAP